MGKFRGSLYTEFLPPRYWRLTEALKLNTDSLNDVDKQMLNEIPGIKCTKAGMITVPEGYITCLLYTSPSPRDPKTSRMPSSA